MNLQQLLKQMRNLASEALWEARYITLFDKSPEARQESGLLEYGSSRLDRLVMELEVIIEGSKANSATGSPRTPNGGGVPDRGTAIDPYDKER